MIKEIFEIKGNEKNALFIFIGAALVSFLQLYLFKPELIEQSAYLHIGLSLALAVGWVVLSLPPLYSFFVFTQPDDKYEVDMPRLVFAMGMIGVFWMLVYTYVCYEFNLNLKTLFRIAIIASLVRFLFWWVYGFINSKNKKKNQSNNR